MLPEIETLGTIVVCEDDAVTRDLLVENLEADRYRALAAPTASDALRFCRYSQPDALLLDLALPDAAGLDVLRRIRGSDGPAAEFDNRLPVLIVTGRSAADDRVRGLAEGASEYLVKPFHYPELLIRLERLLEERAGRAAARSGSARSRSTPPRAGSRSASARCSWRTRSSSCCGRWRPSRAESSPSRSCCVTSGASGRRGGPGPWTRTRAGCGASSTPSAAGS